MKPLAWALLALVIYLIQVFLARIYKQPGTGEEVRAVIAFIVFFAMILSAASLITAVVTWGMS